MNAGALNLASSEVRAEAESEASEPARIQHYPQGITIEHSPLCATTPLAIRSPPVTPDRHTIA